jgi:hypothetical protein
MPFRDNIVISMYSPYSIILDVIVLQICINLNYIHVKNYEGGGIIHK